jgi:hypothetical protein
MPSSDIILYNRHIFMLRQKRPPWPKFMMEYDDDDDDDEYCSILPS